MRKKLYIRTNRELLPFALGLLILACPGILLLAGSQPAAEGIESPESGTVPPELGPAMSIVDLQPFRQVSSNRIKSDVGVQGTATLVNLNPAVNSWYILEVDWQDGSKSTYHLENPQPRTEKVLLDP